MRRIKKAMERLHPAGNNCSGVLILDGEGS